MPLAGKAHNVVVDTPYFSSLEELDAWAHQPKRKLEGILEFIPSSDEPQYHGKLLVCHDYKGGYTESPSALSYTFNFWSSCDTFVYFSHHRVTVPPPGWITAAHRQGVKILGTLIFEPGGEGDCLRLLVGNLPRSVNGPAKSHVASTSLPLSPHYARLLAELARQRGFDGYLLNFEYPLHGGPEQTRTLAAWITVLQSELLSRVGSHGQAIWYDSVVFTGQLAWQDRLNSLNLPFFLSSSGIFSNYTWPRDFPFLSVQYFYSLDSVLTGNAPTSQPHVSKKSLQDIYMGIDVWGRGSHGGGGFGSYKAITHIAPESLGLSVALFGPAWTWESEQDKPGWNWDKWWEYDSKLWVGPVSGEVEVPETPRKKGEPECPHGPFLPIASFFPRNSPPDPFDLPLHTTFSPGVGHAWFVDGTKVYQSTDGWTDIDKQCTVGDMVWPRPVLEWEGEGRDDPLPEALSSICFDDAWNGGSSLRFKLSCAGSEAEEAAFRCVWLPMQSLAFRPRRHYEASFIYKLESNPDTVDVDIGLSVKLASRDAKLKDPLQITPLTIVDTDLPGGWTKLCVEFTTSDGQKLPTSVTGAVGMVIAIVAQDPSQTIDISILAGQLNIYPRPPTESAPHIPMVLWADYTPSQTPKDSASPSGTLTWEIAASFPPLDNLTITSPEDPVSAWKVHPSNRWFPTFLYFNVYALRYSAEGKVGQPEEAVWVGTTGLDGVKHGFVVVPANLPFWSADIVNGKVKVRFFVQGVTDRGQVLRWEHCVFVDGELVVARRA